MHRFKLKSPLLTIAFLLLVSGTSVQAQTIFGGYDCGQWVNKSKGHPMESWVVGYLSGLNSMHVLAGLEPKDPIDELNSIDQAFVWLDNFCKANPLRKVDGGVLELFAELKAKRSRSSTSK